MKDINKLIETSKQVILDCALENGAIVAANPIKPYYSKEAKHYLYVWPRDASYTCIAANVLGIKNIQSKFFNWIIDRAEDFQESGLLYEKYYVNGLQALNRFQPDQGASVLYAIWHSDQHNTIKAEDYKDLVRKLADGICKHWDEDHFDLITNDLWEERHTFPDLKDNFTYSLSSCIQGLTKANEMYPSKIYIETAKSMRELLLKESQRTNCYTRSFGLLNDDHIDASLLGLIWPNEVVDPNSPEMQNTIQSIIDKLTVNNGVHRYEHDEYDGWMYKTMHRKKGAGYWPLLNFWLAIALNKQGKNIEARIYFEKVLDDIDYEKGLIPEQIFTNDIQKAVSPLCWSHAMLILSAKELGLI